MQKTLPIVALVGSPNVGKSSLLNRIIGKPMAITSDVAGTTRDRQYADTAWNGHTFTLVDTAGLDAGIHGELETNVLKQVEVALKEAEILVLVVDGKEEATALPPTLLKKFRAFGPKVFLAVNKLDSPKKREELLEKFKRLGIKKLFGVSATTGAGIGDLLDGISNELEKSVNVQETNSSEPEEKLIAVSIVGKPNVGKSSIFNKILKDERVVVSPTAGTTRTAIDSKIRINDTTYNFIDTAGLKKKEHKQAVPDIYSGFQTFKSIRRSDICFFVLDASGEITKQDQRVAQEIVKMEKGCVILANKCDLLEPEKKKQLKKLDSKLNRKKNITDDRYQTIRDYISHHFPFLWMSPLFFISAKTNEGIENAISSLLPIFEARNKFLAEETLNSFLQKKLKTNPPQLLRDQKAPKVYSLRQLETNPPTFELFVNHPAAISLQFRKFLENSIIKELDFWGTPIKLKLLGKDKK